MERAESQIATAAKTTESHFNSGSLWAPGTLPSRTDTMLRGSCSTADSHLPFMSITDGNRLLVADGQDIQTSRPVFKLGTQESVYAAYADGQGEVPFGPALTGYADASKPKSKAYYSTTFGIDREGPNGHKQAINVNIGDAMQVNGKQLTDQLPHRGTFPIAAEKEGDPHWKWVDATVTLKNGQGNLVVHRVSAAEAKPTKESDWEQVNFQFPLRRQSFTQHLQPEQYWYCNTPGQSYNPKMIYPDYQRANIGKTVILP